METVYSMISGHALRSKESLHKKMLLLNVVRKFWKKLKQELKMDKRPARHKETWWSDFSNIVSEKRKL